MSDAQTIYEFRLACHKRGCPVCSLIQRAGARYLEGTFTESLLDPAIRQKLVKSSGFCFEHTWQSINLKLSDALGHAILYQDLIADILKKLHENEKSSGSRLANIFDSNDPCPACQVEAEALDRIIDSLASALRKQDFLAEFSQSDGLCIPHLKRLLPHLDAARQAVVLDHQQSCLQELKGELGEFIRKSDYRFRDEEMGVEGDSYKRAADMIKGKRSPTEKKDLL
jgi:hypothetical protein